MTKVLVERCGHRETPIRDRCSYCRGDNPGLCGNYNPVPVQVDIPSSQLPQIDKFYLRYGRTYHERFT